MPAVEIKLKNIIFDPKVQTLCISTNYTCPFYNHSHSCPPVAPYMKEEVSKYERFFLIYSIFDLEEQFKKIKARYPERSEYNIKLDLQMKNVLSGNLEREFEKFLENYKEDYVEKLLLYDGTCRVCLNENDKMCTYDEGFPCRYPSKMSYSMEAVGIDVIMTVHQLKLDIEYPSTRKAYRFGLICMR